MNTRKLRKWLNDQQLSRVFTFPRERYYKGIQEDSKLSVKLTGNWETIVGDQDTFVHILEYENYAGFDKSTHVIRNSEVCRP